MSNNTKLLNNINLNEFELAPSQLWGNIRLVPVIKKLNTTDLRLGLRNYSTPYAMTCLDGKEPLNDTKHCYYSYIPSAMVATWTTNESTANAYGCQIERKSKRIAHNIRVENRIAKREKDQQLRFLPLHLAMEGFLGLHFSGPNFKWDEYTNKAMRDGLGSRKETSIHGYNINGFEDALRVFEIHPQQVGVIIFISDALASVFIVPHSNDYHLMHYGLLRDFYGEILFHYGEHLYEPPNLAIAHGNTNIQNFDDLRNLIKSTQQKSREEHEHLLKGMLNRKIDSKIIKRLGKFCLQRFSTDFDCDKTNFIGEAITNKNGAIEYLKTYQLSKTQTRRAYILHCLAENNWNLEETGKAIGCSSKDVICRLNSVGFGYLIKQHILESAIK